MLLVTEAAAEVVKTLTATPQAPDGTGLRIASSTPVPDNPQALQLSAAAGPSENDEVIETAGTHFYLEPQVAAYLEDKVLDAQVDSDGHAHFSLAMQGSARD